MSKKEFEFIDLEEENTQKQPAKKSQQKGKFNLLSVLMILIGVICIGVSVIGIGGIIKEYQMAVDKYDNLESEFVNINKPNSDEQNKPSGSENGSQSSEDQETSETPWYELATVNLKGLQAKYPDIKGWLLFENEDISYPILKGENNDTYLRTTYDGKKANAGSIFIEEDNRDDFMDTHTIIYGHNMKNLSMFGKLNYYKRDENYYESHKYFQIFRGNEILRYQIFSYQDVHVSSYIFQEKHNSARALATRLMSTSQVNAGLDIKDGDRIITLSTCTTDDDDRFVVSAVLVDVHVID